MSTDTDGAPPSVSPPGPDDGPGPTGNGQRERDGRDAPTRAGRRRAAANGSNPSWVQQEIDRRVAARRAGTAEQPVGRHARPDTTETAVSPNLGGETTRSGPVPSPPGDPGGPSIPPVTRMRRPRSARRDRDPHAGGREPTGAAHTLGTPPAPAASAPLQHFAPPEGSPTFGPAAPSWFKPGPRDAPTAPAPPDPRVVPPGRPPLTAPQGPPGPTRPAGSPFSVPGFARPAGPPAGAGSAEATTPAGATPPTALGRPLADAPPAWDARSRPAAPEALGAPPLSRAQGPLTLPTAPPPATPTWPGPRDDPEQDPPAAPERVRVVLSERKRAAHPVRTVEVVQEGTGVGQLLRTSLIRSQLIVSLWFAAAACLALGSLPLLFAIFPEIGRAELLGLRLPWLLLGVLAYPFLLGLGWWHTQTAEKVEQNFADHVQD